MTLHLKPPLEAPVSLQNGAQGTGEVTAENGAAGSDGGVDLEIEGEDMQEALQ
jgi:hypothetical protein